MTDDQRSPRLSAAERARLNPNNDAYWQARGFKRKPKDWRQRKIKIKAEERQRAAAEAERARAGTDDDTQPEAHDAAELDPGNAAYWEARGLGSRSAGRQ